MTSLLDDPERLPLVALLSGEAGIGKTTVWLAGTEAATAHGYRVLSTRPSEAETGFSFAGLTDLLGSTAGEVLPALPPIQQRALEAALLIGEPEVDVDERAVAAAFLGAVRLLAAERALCLAIDDLQWLDAASLTTLRFALARLDDEPIVTLFAVRGDVPDWLRRTVPDERMHTVEMNGLSVGAVHEILRDRLDVAFPRPTLIRIWETSGGNPFFALELAGALQRKGGTLRVGDALPIPATLDGLLQTRLDGLSPGALDLARAAAALAEPTVALVEATAAGSADDLAETLQKEVLELDGQRLRFTHPLLGSAVAARQKPVPPTVAPRPTRDTRPDGGGASPPPSHSRRRGQIATCRDTRVRRPIGTRPRRARSSSRARRARARDSHPDGRRRRPPTPPVRRRPPLHRRGRRASNGLARAGTCDCCAWQRPRDDRGASRRHAAKPTGRRCAVPRGTLGGRG